MPSSRNSAANLGTYNKKRDFKKTREPKGKKRGRGGKQFVVQKHDATRLHYDFRLELDGVMKSWAVPKGPSLDPKQRRLAVHVEDHPIEYNEFEGTIPEGEYGGGTVMIWDRGNWKMLGDESKRVAYNKGKLKFVLEGEKLRGVWNLVRMGGQAGEGGKNWLLIKENDDEARKSTEYDILRDRPDSVATGRTMDGISRGAKATASKKRKVTSKKLIQGIRKKVVAPERK